MNGDYPISSLYYNLSLNALYNLEENQPVEISNEGEVYDHVFVQNLIKVGKCTMLGDFFSGPMDRPLKVFPWEQGYDLFNEVEYQVPEDALVREVDFGILYAGIEPYPVTKTITGYNLEHNTNKWGFLSAKVTIAPMIIPPLEVTEAITTNGEHTIVKRADTNGMTSVTFTVDVPQGGGQVQEKWMNMPQVVNGTTYVFEPDEGYIGISRLSLQLRPLNLVEIVENINENGQKVILPMSLQDGFTKVTINTNVPQTINRKSKVKYMSTRYGLGYPGSYINLETESFILQRETGDVTVYPEETLLMLTWVSDNNGNALKVQAVANTSSLGFSEPIEVPSGTRYRKLQGRFNEGYFYILSEDEMFLLSIKSILPNGYYHTYRISDTLLWEFCFDFPDQILGWLS